MLVPWAHGDAWLIVNYIGKPLNRFHRLFIHFLVKKECQCLFFWFTKVYILVGHQAKQLGARWPFDLVRLTIFSMAFYCILNGCLPAVWVATAPGISWYWVGLGMFLGSKGSPGSSKIQGTGLVAVWLPLRQAHLVVIAKRPQTSQEATRLLQIFWKVCYKISWILVMSIEAGTAPAIMKLKAHGGDKWPMILCEAILWEVSPSVDLCWINQSASLVDFLCF